MRNLSGIPDESVHLVVTSPPYWTLKEYEHSQGQLGDIEDHEEFLAELDKVWAECRRVLVPGGRIGCVVGDVCIPRKQGGRHYVMPLHADIEVHTRRVGLDCLTPILWYKVANGVTEAVGNGSGFYGKPYQPCPVVKNDIESILFMRKGGEYRSVTRDQKILSMLTKEEMQGWLARSGTTSRGVPLEPGIPRPSSSNWAGGSSGVSPLLEIRSWFPSWGSARPTSRSWPQEETRSGTSWRRLTSTRRGAGSAGRRPGLCCLVRPRRS